MSDPDSSPSPTARTGRNSSHASSACEGCRKKKAKCDEARPACTRCRQSGTACIWTVEKDGRTTQGRCEALCAEIAQLKAEVATLKAIIIARGRQHDPEQPQTASVTESAPQSPSALLDPLSVQPLFVQPLTAPAPGNAAAFYGYAQPFAMDAQQELALPELPQGTMQLESVFYQPGEDAFLLAGDVFPAQAPEYPWLADGLYLPQTVPN